MRVILEVESGPKAGHKYMVTEGQYMEVGRSSLTDFAFEHDAQMSDQHFAICSDSTVCSLKDLKSANGTLVNNLPVSGCGVVLRDRDTIAAGDTRFRVLIQGSATNEAIAEAKLAPQERRCAIQKSGRINGTFTVERCHSGLTVCSGQTDVVPVDRLVARLAEESPLYLLVDFHRLRLPGPVGTREPQYLLDWLGEEVAAQISPQFLAALSVDHWVDYLTEGWGTDSIVCAFSKQGQTQLLGSLRQLASGMNPVRSGQGIVGCCWPSVAGPLLRVWHTRLVASLFQVADAVLMESGEEPAVWDLFGVHDVPDWLERLGLKRATAEREAKEAETPSSVWK